MEFHEQPIHEGGSFHPGANQDSSSSSNQYPHGTDAHAHHPPSDGHFDFQHANYSSALETFPGSMGQLHPQHPSTASADPTPQHHGLSHGEAYPQGHAGVGMGYPSPFSYGGSYPRGPQQAFPPPTHLPVHGVVVGDQGTTYPPPLSGSGPAYDVDMGDQPPSSIPVNPSQLPPPDQFPPSMGGGSHQDAPDVEMSADILSTIASALETLCSGMGQSLPASGIFGNSFGSSLDGALFDSGMDMSAQPSAQPSATNAPYLPEHPVPQTSHHGQTSFQGAPIPASNTFGFEDQYPSQATGGPGEFPQQPQSHHGPQVHQDPTRVSEGAGAEDQNNWPTYWSQNAATTLPRYSPVAITIFQPKPHHHPLITSRITSVLSSPPPSSASSPNPRAATSHRRATPTSSPIGQLPASVPATPTPRAGPSRHQVAPTSSPKQPTTSISPNLRSVHPASPRHGHRRTSSSQYSLNRLPEPSGAQPTDAAAEHHTPTFSIIPVEGARGNPVYEVRVPYSAPVDDFADWLAIPNLNRSVQATVADPATNDTLTNLTIRQALGWQLIVIMILYFRAFYFQMLALPSSSFPPLLPKDDVIDVGLVLIISSWIINLLAMRICAGRMPTASSVRHFVETCLNSLEVTVILSIAGQIELNIYTLLEIEQKGWQGLFKPTPLGYYLRRVADPVRHKVLQFYFEASLVNYRVCLGNMRVHRINPDTAYKWGADYAMVNSARNTSLTGNNIHLILKNPSSQKYIHDHERHGTYTIQDGADIAQETIDIVHGNVRENVPVPPDSIHLFRNVNIDSGATQTIGFFAKAAPLALFRTLAGKNPYVDTSNAISSRLPFIGLLPYLVGHINAAFSSLQHFGSETSPEGIVASPELETSYERKGRCVRVWLTEACLGRTTESNLPDLEWINRSLEIKFAEAVGSLDGKREFWDAERSEFIVWDPYVPWSGQSRDFLSYYEGVGSTPAATEEGEVFEGVFVKSPLTDIYDEAAREHRDKREAREKSEKEAKEELQTSDDDSEEILGTEIIFKMAHITKEAAGDAWPMIQEGLKRARRSLVINKKELDRLLSSSEPRPPT